MKIGIIIAILGIGMIMYYGGHYFIESRVKAIENGTAYFCDMGG